MIRAIKMTLILAGVTVATTGAIAQHGPSGHYTARLSARDHFNSNGVRLTDAAAIIRQDRANFHYFGIRDREDQYDSFFRGQRNRAILEQLMRAGRVSPAARNAIVNGEPLIHVDIFNGSITVTVY